MFNYSIVKEIKFNKKNILLITLPIKKISIF